MMNLKSSHTKIIQMVTTFIAIMRSALFLRGANALTDLHANAKKVLAPKIMIAYKGVPSAQNSIPLTVKQVNANSNAWATKRGT